MFLRMVSINIRAEQAVKIVAAYEENVITALRKQPGCSFVALLQNISNEKEAISLTLWNSKADAEAYEKSGVFHRLVESLRSFYEESSEWAFTLTEDLSIEYTPVSVEPIVTSFDDAATRKEYIRRFKGTPYVAQIIRLTVVPERSSEFEEVFNRVILPKYQQTKGFIHIILLRKEKECSLISFWDESFDFRSGAGNVTLDFTRDIVSFLPSDVQWRVLRKNSQLSSVSSEDIHSSMYRCLVGEWITQ
jgi:heme-degrading monooxygenase HmoA